ncbi:MAG: glycerol kinase GlpK [Firmicutes bacterium]|nr:glycerol kinase GlpK [Bacillota bacterium]
MKKYVLTLDQGTTSSRAIIYDQESNIISVAQQEFTQYYPDQGWVEHDAKEIWSSQLKVAKEAMETAGLTFENIETIGITNQRETTVVWDKNTGEPISNAIVWQCRRTSDYCDTLIEAGLSDTTKSKTGLVIDPYFSGTKVRWILENIDGAREKAEAGDLFFGTIDTWLVWNLTKGKLHITDYSNASRTMMFNIHELKWDEEILETLDVPKSMLPQVKPSSQVYGETDPEIFGGPIKISGIAGDQQAALFGQTCFREGEVKSTFGTGLFMLQNTGDKPVESKNGLLTTIGWGLDGKVTYALEGSVFVCGAVIQWLRDELGLLAKTSDSEEMAKSVEDSNGVYIVPAFVGLGAPYWDSKTRGTIFGLTRGANKNHIVRAALESMAYQCQDLLEAMSSDLGKYPEQMMVDGGAAANDFLMQFQSDILNVEVVRPSSVETTSMGAAYLAGLATGYWKDLVDVADNWKAGKRFAPSMSQEDRILAISGWKDAVSRTLGWDR